MTLGLAKGFSEPKTIYMEENNYELDTIKVKK